MHKSIVLLLLISSLQGNAQSLDIQTSNKLDLTISGGQRTAAHKLRDQYRHPAETLKFFGFNEFQSVVEIWPGEGWYTEILAPVLQNNGHLNVAHFSEKSTLPWRRNMVKAYQAKLTARQDIYNKVTITALEPPDAVSIAPENSVDLILSFRSVHNWLADGDAGGVFNVLYKALKPGGVLGIVEHRANPGTSLEKSISTGYVTEEEVILLAKEAGFELAAKSEINANSKDTKNHPKGVWSLPPTFRNVNDTEKASYSVIGESDRMTLKFIKPMN